MIRSFEKDEKLEGEARKPQLTINENSKYIR